MALVDTVPQRLDCTTVETPNCEDWPRGADSKSVTILDRSADWVSFIAMCSGRLESDGAPERNVAGELDPFQSGSLHHLPDLARGEPVLE
jgi:hypothetical protein